MTSEKGHTFEHAFEKKGVYTYYCTPHKAMGMKGAVVVGDVPASLGGGTANGGGTATNTTSTESASGTAENESTSTPADDSAADADSPERTFDGWLANTGNYERVVDKTGTYQGRVAVGANGNEGRFAFDPPAIHVDPGTTVVWKWVTDTASHAVVDADGRYRSEAVAESGHQYAVNFGGNGLSKYECLAYGGRGTRGVAIVGGGNVPSLDLAGLTALGGAAALFGGAFHRSVKLHNETSSGPTRDREG